MAELSLTSIGRTLAASVILLLSTIVLSAPGSHAQELPPWKLSVPVTGNATPDGTGFFFDPAEIPIARVPILVNVTFINQDTITGVNHNFTTEIGGVFYETPLLGPGEVGFVEFWINETGTFDYWCALPGHRELGMEGSFVVGAVAEEEMEGPAGIALRAYWIGLIGIFSMVAVIIISYFVIKAESRHHTDNREHRRRGLP